MADETNARAGDDEHPSKQHKLDKIADQHRQNMLAEQRAGSAAGNLDRDYRSFAGQAQQQESDMTYQQRALRGDFGEDIKAKAIAAYNKGETLENPAELERAARKAKAHAAQPDTVSYHDRALRGELGRDKQVEAQTLAQTGEHLRDPNVNQGPGFVGKAPQSTDTQALHERVAPGGADANVVAQAPVLHAGAESSTGSKTVTSQPATAAPSKPASAG